jgi:hypothetical protein
VKVETASRMSFRGTLILGRSAGEAVETFGATVHLQRLEAVTAFALLDGYFAGASRAGGILQGCAGLACDRRVSW